MEGQLGSHESRSHVHLDEVFGSSPPETEIEAYGPILRSSTLLIAPRGLIAGIL